MREFTDPERAAYSITPGETVVVVPEHGRGEAFLLYRTKDGTRLVGWTGKQVDAPASSPKSKWDPPQSETGYEDRM